MPRGRVQHAGRGEDTCCSDGSIGAIEGNAPSQPWHELSLAMRKWGFSPATAQQRRAKLEATSLTLFISSFSLTYTYRYAFVRESCNLSERGTTSWPMDQASRERLPSISKLHYSKHLFAAQKKLFKTKCYIYIFSIFF